MSGRSSKRQLVAPGVVLGGRYRDLDGQLVVAEDHERSQGGRTGRILVAEAEPRHLPPRRWFCEPGSLTREEPEGRGQP